MVRYMTLMMLVRNHSALDALRPLGRAPNPPFGVSGSAGVMRGFWSSPRPLVTEARPSTARDSVGCNIEVDTPVWFQYSKSMRCSS